MKYSTIALAFTLAGNAAQAQEVTYLSYGAAYTSNTPSIGLYDIDTRTFEGTFEYSINDFYMMANFSRDTFSRVSPRAEYESETAELRAGYMFGTSGLAYVGYRRTEIIDRETHSYSIGAQYSTGSLDIGVHHAHWEELDTSGTSIVVAYDVSPSAEIGLLYTRDDDRSDLYNLTVFGAYETGPLTLEASYQDSRGLNSFLLAEATYEFNDQFRAMGSLGRFDRYDGGTFIGIGGGYQVTENMWLDATYSNFDSARLSDIEIIGISVNFETGSRATAYDRAVEHREAPYNALSDQTRAPFPFGF